MRLSEVKSNGRWGDRYNGVAGLLFGPAILSFLYEKCRLPFVRFVTMIPSLGNNYHLELSEQAGSDLGFSLPVGPQTMI